MSEKRNISLPAELCAAAEEKFGTTFRSVDELVVFMLRELIRDDTVEMDRAEKTAVEARLRDLGYI